jgi:hypothetical protein
MWITLCLEVNIPTFYVGTALLHANLSTIKLLFMYKVYKC